MALTQPYRFFRRMGCRPEAAKRYEEAEAFAKAQDYRFEWRDDEEPWDPGDTNYVPREVLGIIAYDERGEVYSSVWGIADPDRDYQRYMEAELAYERYYRVFEEAARIEAWLATIAARAS